MERNFDFSSSLASFIILSSILATCSSQDILESTSPKTFPSTPLEIMEGSVRLLNGSSSNEGRLEVYWKSKWYAVCGARFDRRKEYLVCRQLGYSCASENGTRHFSYDEDDLTYSVTADHIPCTGYESSLLDCHGIGLREYNCSGKDTIDVTCATTLLESTIPPTTVRLEQGYIRRDLKTVEIYYKNFWTTVCDADWHWEESNVVCRQLGFLSADNSHHKERSYPPGDHFPVLGRLDCFGTEMQWTDCSSYDWNKIDCPVNTRVGVGCISEDNSREGDVRLTGEISENVGRVEIYHNREWGTICDDGWNIDDAEVVCRQLGFPCAVSALDNAHYGQGNGYILLDDVACNGSEHYLLECKHSGWRRHNCGPGEEAGVRCHMPDLQYPRLANGSQPNEGRVEVWNGDHWAKVCSKGGFFENEAHAVCKELGFDEVEYFDNDDRFGHGYGPPLTDVAFRCSEDQNSFSQCMTQIITDSFCRPVVMGCRKNESFSLPYIAMWIIGIVASIIVVICLLCMFKQLKTRHICSNFPPDDSSAVRTDNDAFSDQFSSVEDQQMCQQI